MAIATGVNKQLIYKAESTWGTLAAATGPNGQALRRVTSTLNLKKDTYASNEIRADYQDADFRHGMRKVEGTLAGELSPGTYKDFFAAAVRKAFASVTSISSLTLTVAASGSFYTITRSGGSWITDGIRAGMVVRPTAGLAAGSRIDCLVVTITTTVLTVAPLNAAALVIESTVAACTVTVQGKVTYVPQTGHTDPSFSFEEWHNDITQSERFTGCKVSTLDLKMPATGMATIDVGIMGKDMAASNSQYFTSPVAATTTGVTAAVNGVLIVNGTKLVTITGLNIKINGNMTTEPTAGSNTAPDIFKGRVQVDGDFNAFFEDGTLRDLFLAETSIALAFALTTDNTGTGDFIAGYMPRIKLNDAAKDDGDKGIKRAYPFKALLQPTSGAGTEVTTIQFQDSQA